MISSESRLSIGQIFLLAVISLLIGTLLVAFFLLGPILAIKGSYMLLGAVLAGLLLIFCSGRRNSSSISVSRLHFRYIQKIVCIVAIFAIFLSTVSVDRATILVITLSIGYVLLLIQIIGGIPPKHILPQIAILFAIGPLTKYLTVGFYFGHGDLFGHVQAVQSVLRTGGLTEIQNIYPTYEYLPVLHGLVASISSYTGLPVYDALILLGIWCFTLTIFFSFYFARCFLSATDATYIAFIFSVLPLISFYATFFFPQALATALLFVLLFVVSRSTMIKADYFNLYKITGLVLITVILFTHHMTTILFLLISVGFYLPSVIRIITQKISVVEDINTGMPRILPLLLLVVTSLSYQAYLVPDFIRFFVEFVNLNVLNPRFFVREEGGVRETIGLGTKIPYHTTQDAVISLLSIEGIFYIILFSVFLIGVMNIINNIYTWFPIIGILLVGAIGSIAIFPSPIADLAQRIGLPVTLFFAVIVGLGLVRLFSNIDVNSTRSLLPVFLVVMLCVTGPLVAGDDLYEVHEGPGLYEAYSTPEPQVAFSRSEYEQLGTTAEFINSNNRKTSSLWITRWALEHFGTDVGSPDAVTENGICSETSIVYRTEWKNHQVGYEGDPAGTIYFGETWLSNAINQNNKTYSTGKVAIISNEGAVCVSDAEEL